MTLDRRDVRDLVAGLTEAMLVSPEFSAFRCRPGVLNPLFRVVAGLEGSTPELVARAWQGPCFPDPPLRHDCRVTDEGVWSLSKPIVPEVGSEIDFWRCDQMAATSIRFSRRLSHGQRMLLRDLYLELVLPNWAIRHDLDGWLARARFRFSINQCAVIEGPVSCFLERAGNGRYHRRLRLSEPVWLDSQQDLSARVDLGLSWCPSGQQTLLEWPAPLPPFQLKFIMTGPTYTLVGRG